MKPTATQDMSLAEYEKFVDYVDSFYGKEGIYAADMPNNGFTRSQIEAAANDYVSQTAIGKLSVKGPKWGGGDSMDRERVREILLNSGKKQSATPASGKIVLAAPAFDNEGNPDHYRFTLKIADEPEKSILQVDQLFAKSKNWGATGGGWYVGTLIDANDSDTLVIDGGQKWSVNGLKAALEECKEILNIKDEKMLEYKLGDEYSEDFDYEGMLNMGLLSDISWGVDKLRKLFDSFQDVNYHTEAELLDKAIKALKSNDKESAQKYMKEFRGACVDAMSSDAEVEYAVGGEISKGESLLHHVRAEMSSGYLGSRIYDLGYKDGLQYSVIDRVRLVMAEMLEEHGDEKYSMENMNRLIKDAVEKALGKNNISERSVGAEYYSNGGQIVLNEGNGKVINKLYAEWDKIKTKKQADVWKDKVKGTSFGTYGSISILDVLDKFEPKFRNDVEKKAFYNEVASAKGEAVRYAKGGVVSPRSKWNKFFEKFKRTDMYIGELVKNNSGNDVFEIQAYNNVDKDAAISFFKENDMPFTVNSVNGKKIFVHFPANNKMAKGGNVEENLKAYRVYFEPQTTIGGNAVQKNKLKEYVNNFIEQLEVNKNIKDKILRQYFDFDYGYGFVVVEGESAKNFILSVLPLWDFQNATDKYETKEWLAEGGTIPNNYEGKGLGEVWDEWTPEQVEHFLRDHDSVLHLDPPQTREIIKMSWIEFLKSDRVSAFKKHSIYKSLNSHINEGQYASGGSISHIPNNYEGQTGHEIWDAWTISQRKHFLLDHMEEIGTNAFEINHKLPEMQYVDLPPIVASVLYKHISEGQYAKGGKIEKTVKTSKVGDRQHTIDAKVSRNLKIYIYKYNGKEGYVVSAKFTGYPEVFVERVFTTYSEAVKDAEERAGMFRVGGMVKKPDTYAIQLYISGSVRGIAHPEVGETKQESFNLAVAEAKQLFAIGKYSSIEIIDESKNEVKYLFDEDTAPKGMHVGKKEFEITSESEFDEVMKEFEAGTLKGKDGKKVTSRADAVLIGYEKELIASELEDEVAQKYATGGAVSGNKFEKVMREFKRGTLTDGHGKKVTSRGQAMAIAHAQSEHPQQKMETGGKIGKVNSAVRTFNTKVTVGIDDMGRSVIFYSKNYDNRGNYKGESELLTDDTGGYYLTAFDYTDSNLQQLRDEDPKYKDFTREEVNKLRGKVIKFAEREVMSAGGSLFQFKDGEKVKVTLTENTDGKTGQVDGVIVSRGSGSSQLVEYVLDGKKIQKYKDAGETVHKYEKGGNIDYINVDSKDTYSKGDRVVVRNPEASGDDRFTIVTEITEVLPNDMYSTRDGGDYNWNDIKPYKGEPISRVYANGGTTDSAAETRAQRVKRTFDIADIMMAHKISTVDTSLAEFSKQILAVSKKKYHPADIERAYKLIGQVGLAKGGTIEVEAEMKAEAIKTAVQIGAIAAEHNIKAAELSVEEFSKKIFDASKIAFSKADLMFSHKVLSKIKYASGGETESVTEVKVGGYPYYLRKIDHTHLYVSNDKEKKGTPWHVGQYKSNDDDTFYKDILKWLSGEMEIAGKSYKAFYKDGGKIGFDGLAKKVAKEYTGKPVADKYKKEYGKTYSATEAKEVGAKVAAKVATAKKKSATAGKYK